MVLAVSHQNVALAIHSQSSRVIETSCFTTQLAHFLIKSMVKDDQNSFARITSNNRPVLESMT